MGKPLNILLAGFGGQGILFAGKVIAAAGLAEGREISWLPSYGPEMRGGTANCSVCLSDDPIGSPLVVEPDVLVAMNQPSLEKFIDEVAPGGIVIYDSTLISGVTARDDIKVYPVPSTQLAEDNDLKGLANIILVGKVLRETEFCPSELLDETIRGLIPPKRAHLLEPNLKALAIGKEYDNQKVSA